MTQNQEYILQMKNISKSFPGVIALNNVSMSLKKGEVHALIGENGAGKSTFVKIISGIDRPDKGSILLDGREINFKNPKDAIEHGISMIHQELNLIPEMTIADNLLLGREICYKISGIVNSREANKKTKLLLEQLELDLDPRAKISTLSIAEMQMVEILKAISYNADIIIMDEPTSAITVQEVEKFFNVINHLKKQGKSIIYISHKIEEIFKIADRVTVLRDGHCIDTKLVTQVNLQVLISMMVGRDLKDMFVKQETKIGSVLIEVKNFSKKGVFQDINFKVHRGEILGVAGLMGAGRTEVMEAIFGGTSKSQGEIILAQKKVNFSKPLDAIKHKIALVTEDRKLSGLNLKASIKDNISIVNLKEYVFARLFINLKKEQKAVSKQISALRIKTPNLNTNVGELSGGNQQKVVLAKWLLNVPDVLILDEPTRGIDVGAKAEIYKIITELANQGKAIILVSSEMTELISMSNRLIVFSNGRITGEFMKDKFVQEDIIWHAMGYTKKDFDYDQKG
jgi:inositol transport system ATP-binding protein